MRMTLLAFYLRQRDHYRHFGWAALAGRNFVRLAVLDWGLGIFGGRGHVGVYMMRPSILAPHRALTDSDQ